MAASLKIFQILWFLKVLAKNWERNSTKNVISTSFVQFRVRLSFLRFPSVFRDRGKSLAVHDFKIIYWISDYYAVVPPLETFMDIPDEERQKHFYQVSNLNEFPFVVPRPSVCLNGVWCCKAGEWIRTPPNCSIYLVAFQSLSIGDIVVGSVSGIQDSGLIITLSCLDNGKARDIDHLHITVSVHWILPFVCWSYWPCVP